MEIHCIEVIFFMWLQSEITKKYKYKFTYLCVDAYCSIVSSSTVLKNKKFKKGLSLDLADKWIDKTHLRLFWIDPPDITTDVDRQRIRYYMWSTYNLLQDTYTRFRYIIRYFHKESMSSVMVIVVGNGIAIRVQIKAMWVLLYSEVSRNDMSQFIFFVQATNLFNFLDAHTCGNTSRQHVAREDVS